ncbi:MAG: hypothetical protein IJ901_06665 [Bacteroidaceae bacterium]|nr:hypothetical protein [Bacteroidaceae bacterium]
MPSRQQCSAKRVAQLCHGSSNAVPDEQHSYATAVAMQCQTSSIVMPRQEENCDT